MAVFSYLVINKRGKEIRGNLETSTKEAALAELRQSGNLVVSIDEVGLLNREIKLSAFSPRPKPRDLAVFCRQFVGIFGAGVPLSTCLEMLGEQTINKRLSKAILECKKSIERGEPLSSSMARWPDAFPPMFITMIEAGEASGALDLSFSRLADQFEKEARLKENTKKATTYPTIIAIVAILVIMVLLAYVVPTFEGVLSELGVPLPGLTVWTLTTARFVQHNFLWLLLGFALFLLVLRAYKATSSGNYFFARLELVTPLFGPLAKKTASARMARTLQNLMAAGLPLVDALTITANTMPNVYFKDALLEAREAVTLGSPLAPEFAKARLFPPLVRHMVSIGEEAGTLESMLSRMADYFEEEVESATARLMIMIEPAIIVVLAVIIAVIVISILLPMGAMYSGLSGL